MGTTTRVTSGRVRWLRGGAALALSALLAACGGPGAMSPGAADDDAVVGEPGAAVETPPAGDVGAAVEPTADEEIVATPGAAEDTPAVLPTAGTGAEAGTGGGGAMTGTATAGEVGDLPPESATLTVSDIMQDPEAYYGQQITVVGEAQRIFGSTAFKLDEDSFLTAGIDNDLMVIGAQQDNPAVETTWLNNQVQVTGTLRQYVQAEFEQEFDWFQPGTEWEGEIEENQPYLVADSVTRLEEGVFDTGLGRGTGALEGAPAGTLTVAEVTGNLDTYAGQTVTVQGEVQEVYALAGSNVLRLDEDALLMGGIDNDLIVVGAPLGDATLNEDGWLDSIVRVTGTVRDFNRTELEQDLGLTLDDPAFAAWEGEPVLVAESAEQVR